MRFLDLFSGVHIAEKASGKTRPRGTAECSAQLPLLTATAGRWSEGGHTVPRFRNVCDHVLSSRSLARGHRIRLDKHSAIGGLGGSGWTHGRAAWSQSLVARPLRFERLTDLHVGRQHALPSQEQTFLPSLQRPPWAQYPRA